MWREGTIGIPKRYGGGIAHYWAKVYKEPSEEFGIDGGKISKLTIKIDGRTIVNYDRGWDIEPDLNDEATQIAYWIVIECHN